MSLREVAAVTGVGETQYMRGTDRTPLSFQLEASLRAIEDAAALPLTAMAQSGWRRPGAAFMGMMGSSKPANLLSTNAVPSGQQPGCLRRLHLGCADPPIRQRGAEVGRAGRLRRRRRSERRSAEARCGRGLPHAIHFDEHVARAVVRMSPAPPPSTAPARSMRRCLRAARTTHRASGCGSVRPGAPSPRATVRGPSAAAWSRDRSPAGAASSAWNLASIAATET